MSQKGDVVFVDDDDDRMSVSSDMSYEEIERANCAARLRGFLFRLILSLIVIGMCSGALIWSFQKGESGSYNGEHIRDASKNFSIFISEYTTKDGTYKITKRKPTDVNDNNLDDGETYPSFWYQDNENKRLVHRRDNQTTLFIYSTHSYWARYDKYGDIINCIYDHTTTYDSYIARLGLTDLTREHSEYEVTHHHSKVYIYNGDPTDVIQEGTPQDAFLVTAYADAYTGALLGWDTYFTANANSSLVFQISYWYDSMTAKNADPAVFDEPAECEPTYRK